MAPAGIGLLSLFVFICSFIPIAGVFISTTPIAFVALTEYGFMKVRCCFSAASRGPLWLQAVLITKNDYDSRIPCDAQLAITIAMVIGIHFVEAYGLNPGAFIQPLRTAHSPVFATALHARGA